MPFELRLVVDQETAGDLFGVARVDRCAGRTRGAKGQSAKLQPRRSGPRALFDEVERKAAHFGVLLVLQHFKSVDDRADRADDVVTNPRAQQRRKIERIEREVRHFVHPCSSANPPKNARAMRAAFAILRETALDFTLHEP